MARAAFFSSLGVLVLLSGCGVREVEPPRAPAMAMPKDLELRTTPPPPGVTRVALDANDERATVREIVEVRKSVGTAYAKGASGTFVAYSETDKPVCVAPCVVDLEPGMHVLRFASTTDDRMSTATIQIGERPKIIRHAMGRTEGAGFGEFAGALLAVFGGTALITGGALYAAEEGAEKDNSKLRSASLGIIAGGAIGLLAGISLSILSRPTHQAGATTEMAWRN